MLTILDPLLVVIALVICITGFFKRSKMWMKGKPDDEKAEGSQPKSKRERQSSKGGQRLPNRAQKAGKEISQENQ